MTVSQLDWNNAGCLFRRSVVIQLFITTIRNSFESSCSYGLIQLSSSMHLMPLKMWSLCELPPSLPLMSLCCIWSVSSLFITPAPHTWLPPSSFFPIYLMIVVLSPSHWSPSICLFSPSSDCSCLIFSYLCFLSSSPSCSLSHNSSHSLPAPQSSSPPQFLLQFLVFTGSRLHLSSHRSSGWGSCYCKCVHLIM